MWKDNETDIDLLGYSVHAKMLKNIVLNEAMLPISIGVFGNWGSGKSSLMLLLEKEISNCIGKEKENDPSQRVLQIKFNSWQFENYENTKYSLIENILRAISKDISQNRDYFDKADELLTRIKWLSAASLVFSKTIELLPEKIRKLIPSLKDLRGILKEEDYEDLIADCESRKSSRIIPRFRKDFEELVAKASYKCIVVYIDDLDRCSPNRVIECLEAIKLFLNVDKTAFIIGADERLIEYAIDKHYPIDTSQESPYRHFSDYLEKLIQLPYKLPRLSRREQETYILLLLCEHHLPNRYLEIHKDYSSFRQQDLHSSYGLKELKSRLPRIDFTTVERMSCIIPLMQEFLNGNPRQLKRFMNTLRVRLELASAAQFKDIDAAILAKLMTLEYDPLSRERFEDLYQRQNMYGGIVKEIDKIEDEAKTGSTTLWGKEWDSPKLCKWLSSKPSFAGINLVNYYWISRESLKHSEPVASNVTAHVYQIWNRLMLNRSISSAKSNITIECKSLTDEERLQLIILLNQELIKEPKNKAVWNILNGDDNGLIVSISIDELKMLLKEVQYPNLPTSASFFLKRMISDDSINKYVGGLNFSNPLKNALKS